MVKKPIGAMETNFRKNHSFFIAAIKPQHYSHALRLARSDQPGAAMEQKHGRPVVAEAV